MPSMKPSALAALANQRPDAVHQILIATDQLANAALGGWAGETISARAYREGVINGRPFWGTARRLIDAVARLFFGQRNHCLDAFAGELARVNNPADARTN